MGSLFCWSIEPPPFVSGGSAAIIIVAFLFLFRGHRIDGWDKKDSNRIRHNVNFFSSERYFELALIPARSVARSPTLPTFLVANICVLQQQEDSYRATSAGS